MAITELIRGRYVNLRSCTENDAEFTRDIRKDPLFVEFLPKIDNTVEEQKAWIRRQREKEGDYFFVVWDKEGNRIGTISIYDVHGNHATSGRLIIKGTNPFHGIEAQLLVYRFAYGILCLDYVDGYIWADNTRAIRFSKNFGDIHTAPETDENGREIIKIRNCKEKFTEIDNKFSSIIYRGE